MADEKMPPHGNARATESLIDGKIIPKSIDIASAVADAEIPCGQIDWFGPGCDFHLDAAWFAANASRRFRLRTMRRREPNHWKCCWREAPERAILSRIEIDGQLVGQVRRYFCPACFEVGDNDAAIAKYLEWQGERPVAPWEAEFMSLRERCK